METRREGPREESFARSLARGDTGRALGLASAAMATNVIGLVVTVLFARLLGGHGYGSLAALVAAFLILALPGQALQVAAARQVSSEGGEGWRPAFRRWMRDLAVAAIALAGVGVLLRQPIADLIGVKEEWGAAAVLPSACIWLVLCIERGVLQGLGQYRLVGLSLVGEATSRLVTGAVLILAGLGPAGGFAGTGLSVITMSLVLWRPLHGALVGAHEVAGAAVRRLRDLVRRALVPLLALGLLAWLQNVDLIVVKHQAATDTAASSYAAAAVAAKMPIWLAVGLALFLLPETARRATSGEDARSVLLRTLGIVVAAAVPMIALYAVAGRKLLEVVFGPDLGVAHAALPLLGIAMSLLACVYLVVQFLLGMHRWRFLPLLAAASALEPAILSTMGSDLNAIALSIAGLELVLFAALLTLALRSTAWVGAAEPDPVQ
jgi:O-antigen/teichoic acid export membrane protein